MQKSKHQQHNNARTQKSKLQEHKNNNIKNATEIKTKNKIEPKKIQKNEKESETHKGR
jgi:hypothetical protein